jgi:hypothetical protein
MDQPNRRLTGRVGTEPVSKATRCDFCREELSLGQEFVYQVESLNFHADPIGLEIIRRLPTYQGEPLRLCTDCRASIEVNVAEMEDEDRADAWAGAVAWKMLLYLLMLPMGALVAFLAAGALNRRALVSAAKRCWHTPRSALGLFPTEPP